MKETDVRNDRSYLPTKEDQRVYFGRNSEYLITEEGDSYIILSDEDGDRTRIYNTDIDALIRALKLLKESL